jgi:hypothetical protein
MLARLQTNELTIINRTSFGNISTIISAGTLMHKNTNQMKIALASSFLGIQIKQIKIRRRHSS